MANYNIDDLGAIPSLSDADLIEVFSGGINYKGTVLQFKTALGVGVTDWNLSTNLFPSGSVKGQRYYGISGPTTTLLDRTGITISTGVIATSLLNNASTTDPLEWALQYTII